MASLPFPPHGSYVIAFDLVGAEYLNLDRYTLLTAAGDDQEQVAANWRPGDWCGIGSVGKWPQTVGVPFALADDSVVDVSRNGQEDPFEGDNQGIIDSTNTLGTDRFFGIVDTVNDRNEAPIGAMDPLPDGTCMATWEFDIYGYSDLVLAIDMAAMGNFNEDDDQWTWSYSVDGGANEAVFQSSVVESTSAGARPTNTYQMDDDDIVVLIDPMAFNGVVLDDNFRTLQAPLAGVHGYTLTLTLSGAMDGESAVAFRNIQIAGKEKKSKKSKKKKSKVCDEYQN